MKMIKLYTWFIGSFNDFAKSFRDNENLFAQARSFWNHLSQSSLLLFIGGLVLALLVVFSYYTWFNNQPGRHYKPKYWWLGMLMEALLVFIYTLIVEWIVAKPQLDGAFVLELKLALCNILYGTGLYALISFVWCNFNCFPTNAYRYLKIKKS